MTFPQFSDLFSKSIGEACRVRSFGFFDAENERTLSGSV
jgi:hypothetical protein